MTDNDKPEDAAGEAPTEAFPAQHPQAPEPEAEQPKRGSVRFQDPATTTPREPTLAEQRARQRARKRESDEARAARLEAEDKARTRRRIFIGSGVTVGLVAMVAVWVVAMQPDEVSATCVDDSGHVAPGSNSGDDYCDEDYVRSHGGYYSGGFYYIGGHSYRYNYGGSVGSGGYVSGGSYTKPSSNTKVTTHSGKTVQRGGFGVSGGSKSGGS
ncbi:hypothetical protein [Labedaea rhizosphaerae]|uniref:Uncharacterized protein n=1 Tax=Labedaea rhizosphaerae TaxID=598644 RepID=A0A4R6SMB0_LABRH|nr:hypothetical protein [Labedaea rhizosphaerae]TDQ05021.1 hypothetical protein EV186_101985 [Labedaea rhizosphaerae]